MVNADETVSTTFLADLLGLSRQSIARLAREEVFAKASRGAYPLGPSVRAYIEYRLAGEVARRGTGSSDRVRDARATEIELRIAQMDRKLISMEEAEAALESISGAFITLLSTLPARITRDPREQQRIEAVIDAERLRLSDRFTETAAKMKSGAGIADDEEE